MQTTGSLQNNLFSRMTRGQPVPVVVIDGHQKFSITPYCAREWKKQQKSAA